MSTRPLATAGLPISFMNNPRTRLTTAAPWRAFDQAAKRLALLVFLGFAALAPLRAQAPLVPALINYQGRVAVDTVNFEGVGLFKFALVNEDGTMTFWSNDLMSVAGSEPVDAVSLPVVKGLYSVLLGDITIPNMQSIPAEVFANPDVRLRVWFDDGGGVNGSQLLTPDQRLAPSAYLADGAVRSAAIADGTITAAKLAPASIDGTRVAPASLDFSHFLALNAPGAGQVLGFDGASLNWTAPGSGDGIWTLNGTNAYYTSGKVGIGTNAPATSLHVNTGSFAITGVSGLLNLQGAGKGALITTAAIGDPAVFISASDFDNFPPTAIPLILQNNAGGVGIGVSPRAGYRLEVAGPTAITPGGSGGEISFGTPNGETGLNIIGAGRADLRFDGTTLKMVVGPVGGPPSANSGIAINTSGNVGIGTASPQAKLHVVGTTRTSVLTITGGADIAEPFPLREEEVEKGSVVVIDEGHPGRLKRSVTAYDKRVAGIVSGANGINTGISLRQEGALDGGQNVALSGRVYVKANTSAGPIAPGDFLTTSDIPGEAMKAADHDRAQGAILGKAMTGLAQDAGPVLVLVTLQ